MNMIMQHSGPMSLLKQLNAPAPDVFTSTIYETEHPVVHVHPETGERHLLLGHFVKKFVGLSSGDSAQLFNILQQHVIQLENNCSWKWSAGDVVFGITELPSIMQ